MHKKIIAAVMLFNCSISYAKNTAIYRWVDNNNVVHYSHEHPANKDYAEVKVEVSYSPSPTAENDNIETVKNNNRDNEEAVDISHLSAEVIKQNCESSKVNLTILDSFDRILVKDKNGKDRVLSEEEKLEQVELSNKYVKIYCDAANKQ